MIAARPMALAAQARIALLDAGLLPFIPGDLFKTIPAALALPGAWRLVRR